jgi:WD40 repeat protein
LDDNTIQVVRMSDGAIRHTLVGHADPALDLRFPTTGTQLFSTSHDGFVRVWDTTTGSALLAIETGFEVLGIGLSPDGATLAVVPGDGPVQLRDVATGQLLASLGGTGGYDTSDPIFSPDGQYLAVDLAAGIFIWRLADGLEIWSAVANSMGVAFSPEGRYLAYTDADEGNKVFLGPADTRNGFQTIDEMQSPVWELFFSPHGSLLAATDGVEIRIWHVPDGSLVAFGKTTCPTAGHSPKASTSEGRNGV